MPKRKRNTHGGRRPGAGRPRIIADPVEVKIRLPGKLLAAIDAWATANGIARSEAIRLALGEYLAAGVQKD